MKSFMTPNVKYVYILCTSCVFMCWDLFWICSICSANNADIGEQLTVFQLPVDLTVFS